MGWILFKLEPDSDLSNVKDLQQDALVQWQHRYYREIAFIAGYGLPALLGGLWGGWSGALGGLLLGGVARMVAVQQFTFFINSMCHTLGHQPYSTRNTARDSAIMAFFTFGEGYHNFHHAFQHDYRNGVKPWQFDPTKWSIWLLAKLGLVSELRRVPVERIQLAEMAEKQRALDQRLASGVPGEIESLHERWAKAKIQLQATFDHWDAKEREYRRALEDRLAAGREKWAQTQQEWREAREALHAAMRDWRETYRLLHSELAGAGAGI
jgi:stearoyl-CoA desaturase (delta-9 desaturase)